METFFLKSCVSKERILNRAQRSIMKEFRYCVFWSITDSDALKTIDESCILYFREKQIESCCTTELCVV